MKTTLEKPLWQQTGMRIFATLSRETLMRRDFLAGSAAIGATFVLPGELAAAADGKKTFTILHTNDMHCELHRDGAGLGLHPFTLNDDNTRGGYARLAGLIAKRKEARKDQGPVLVLDAGDYSMGTAFSAATRETGGELHLMGLMGYDATTFGNHEFDLGPDGLAQVHQRRRQGRPHSGSARFEYQLPRERRRRWPDLQRLTTEGVVRRYLVIERGGIRFGVFGVLGKEAMFYTSGEATTFADPIEIRQGDGEDPARDGEGGSSSSRSATAAW